MNAPAARLPLLPDARVDCARMHASMRADACAKRHLARLPALFGNGVGDAAYLECGACPEGAARAAALGLGVGVPLPLGAARRLARSAKGPGNPPCARGCGRRTRKPAGVCRPCEDRERAAAARTVRPPCSKCGERPRGRVFDGDVGRTPPAIAGWCGPCRVTPEGRRLKEAALRERGGAR